MDTSRDMNPSIWTKQERHSEVLNSQVDHAPFNILVSAEYSTKIRTAETYPHL